MINFAESSSLPADHVEHLMDLEYEYGLRIPGGILSVTTGAHDFYEFSPVVDVVPCGLPRKEYRDQRSPVAHVVLVSPEEALFEDLPHEKTHYARKLGKLSLWVAHPERPEEYGKDAFAKSAAACRGLDPRFSAMDDSEVVEHMLGVEDARAVKADLPARQLGDMINSLEPVAFNQVIRMRETSYAMTKERRALLRSSAATHVQIRDGAMGFTHEIITTPAVRDYALRRTQALGEAIFGTYFQGGFSRLRTFRAYTREGEL